ncbi:alcohol dehydrogenase [Histoplasma capsulatum var. duboisii H88]|uniref:Alcohol dehydrogenase n=2 Tax=Ajellomyces capsulatus TaxID=5037 RepID=F0UC14_AJEC8|nr:alcohol dehydrogenase [Histoplasma capsulatum H143]EGC43960.1 alcohol dehydrogenase [Histoplasma capsulatum var. duboisii H88]
MGEIAEVPKQAKAIVYDNPGTISTKVVTVDVPEPGPGEVLINLTHSGVCHSDYGIMTNRWKNLPAPTAAGQVGGHEGVGKVVKLGPGTESSGVELGARVGVKWLQYACGNCEPCGAGVDACCVKSKVSGYYSPGTFQQYVTSPASYVTPIPDSLPSDLAAPLLCAGVTVYSALKRSQARPGDWVIISGAGGGLGHIATQLGSRGLGHRIIGIDHGSKRDIVLESGAEHFIDITQFTDNEPKGGKLAEHVQSLTGGLGAHAVIVCTSSNAAYAQGMYLLRMNGVLVCVGIPENVPLPIGSSFPAHLIGKQLSIVGSAVGTKRESIETMEFGARGIIQVHFRTEKMDALTDVFKEMERGDLKGRVVLDLS